MGLRLWIRFSHSRIVANLVPSSSNPNLSWVIVLYLRLGNSFLSQHINDTPHKIHLTLIRDLPHSKRLVFSVSNQKSYRETQLGKEILHTRHFSHSDTSWLLYISIISFSRHSIYSHIPSLFQSKTSSFTNEGEVSCNQRGGCNSHQQWHHGTQILWVYPNSTNSSWIQNQ